MKMNMMCKSSAPFFLSSILSDWHLQRSHTSVFSKEETEEFQITIQSLVKETSMFTASTSQILFWSNYQYPNVPQIYARTCLFSPAIYRMTSACTTLNALGTIDCFEKDTSHGWASGVIHLSYAWCSERAPNKGHFFIEESCLCWIWETR